MTQAVKSMFSGYIDTSRHPGSASIHVEAQQLSWDGGSLAWQAGNTVDFHRSGGMICVCSGRPCFPGGSRAGNRAEQWLELYSLHGSEATNLVSGSWSLAILMPERGDLLLAVDRFSIETLCHAQEGDRISFAERADEVPVVDRGLDTQSIYDYLHFHMIPAPSTVFRNVSRLPGGHALIVRNGSSQVRPYWRHEFVEDLRVDFQSAKSEFLRLVEDAVRRLAVEGRVGSFLSGGTDSSTVAGMLCRVSGRECDTYSIGFDSEGYDEMEYARLASRHFGTKHHEYYVTPDDLLSGIPEVARYYDQPFGNSSAVPAYFCARVAKADGITHLLAGDGGDELFGGNSRYATQRLFDAYNILPQSLRRGVLEPLLADVAWTRKIPGLRQAGGYMRHARVPLPDRMETFNLIEALGVESILTPSFLAGIDRGAPLKHRREVWHKCSAKSLVNRMLAYDWRFTLADSDLPKVRGTTRLAGVSVGFPLLDNALTDFSMTLEPEWKLKGMKLRWFFKESLRGFLPDEIISKKKHGFGLPFGPWAIRHAGLRKLAQNSLENLVDRSIVQGNFVHDLFHNHLPAHPGYYGEMVWILMMLEIWLSGQSMESKVMRAA
jgi:asparagine synthase (glutamine-hydrolysing)